MQRPLKLLLAPHETYPTQRLNSCPPQGNPMEMEDMPKMATFVYDYYIKKVQAMKTAFYVGIFIFHVCLIFIKT